MSGLPHLQGRSRWSSSRGLHQCVASGKVPPAAAAAVTGGDSGHRSDTAIGRQSRGGSRGGGSSCHSLHSTLCFQCSQSLRTRRDSSTTSHHRRLPPAAAQAGYHQCCGPPSAPGRLAVCVVVLHADGLDGALALLLAGVSHLLGVAARGGSGSGAAAEEAVNTGGGSRLRRCAPGRCWARPQHLQQLHSGCSVCSRPRGPPPSPPHGQFPDPGRRERAPHLPSTAQAIRAAIRRLVARIGVGNAARAWVGKRRAAALADAGASDGQNAGVAVGALARPLQKG